MKTIFKYEIPHHVSGAFSLSMPEGAEVLALQMQRGVPYIWAKVGAGLLTERQFRIVATGERFRDDERYKYVDTFQDQGYVWHLFEVSLWAG